MSLENREHTARPDVVAHIISVAELGPVELTDPRHGAVHGASLETLRSIIITGNIAGVTPGTETGSYQIGDISINPTKKLLSYAHPQYAASGFMVPSEWYAQRSAKEHFFLDALGLPFSDPECRKIVLEMFGDIEFDGEDWDTTERKHYFESWGISTERFFETIEQAMMRNGFLFGISSDIKNDGNLELLYGDDVDIKLRTFGKGLSFRYISGIEPLGPVEKRFLDGLRFGSKITAR